MSLTGLGSSLFQISAVTTKLVSANYKVRGISGGGRSLSVIDDSHLGQTKGQGLQLCFGDLFSQEPFVLDAQMDTENVTIFENINSNGTAATGTTDVFDNPVLLGDAAGTPPTFALTLPVSTFTAGVLTFTGAIIRDSGYNLVTDGDRPRVQLTVQPDMQTYWWITPIAP